MNLQKQIHTEKELFWMVLIVLLIFLIQLVKKIIQLLGLLILIFDNLIFTISLKNQHFTGNKMNFDIFLILTKKI